MHLNDIMIKVQFRLEWHYDMMHLRMVIFLVEKLKNVEKECIERVKAIQRGTGYKYEVHEQFPNELVEVNKKLQLSLKASTTLCIGESSVLNI